MANYRELFNIKGLLRRVNYFIVVSAQMGSPSFVGAQSIHDTKNCALFEMRFCGWMAPRLRGDDNAADGNRKKKSRSVYAGLLRFLLLYVFIYFLLKLHMPFYQRFEINIPSENTNFSFNLPPVALLYEPKNTNKALFSIWKAYHNAQLWEIIEFDRGKKVSPLFWQTLLFNESDLPLMTLKENNVHLFRPTFYALPYVYNEGDKFFFAFMMSLGFIYGIYLIKRHQVEKHGN